MDIRITDVRHIPADSAFLIDDGTTSVLCDSGFAFTGEDVAKNIRSVLGERNLDYIFLTHSHYDHALGAIYVRKHYPNAKIIATEYAANIFQKPSARQVMRDLDKKFSLICGVQDYEDMIDELSVDVSVSDGDIINAGDMTFEVVSLPGHTKCSVGYYLKEEKLLLSSETLGIFDGKETILPSYLVGYQMTLDSIRKIKSFDIKNILLSHQGLLDEKDTAFFLDNIEKSAVETAKELSDILSSGKTAEDAMLYVKEKYYKGGIKDIYPIDAFNLNTSIMVRLIEREILGKS